MVGPLRVTGASNGDVLYRQLLYVTHAERAGLCGRVGRPKNPLTGQNRPEEGEMRGIDADASEGQEFLVWLAGKAQELGEDLVGNRQLVKRIMLGDRLYFRTKDPHVVGLLF